MGEESVTRESLDGRRRPRGPEIKWHEDIHNDLTGVGIQTVDKKESGSRILERHSAVGRDFKR